MDSRKERPFTTVPRLAGAVLAFLWLGIYLQFHLVNHLGWSPLFFLGLGLLGTLACGLLGWVIGLVLEGPGRVLPAPLRWLGAFLIPAAAVYFLVLARTIDAGVLEAREAVVGAATTRAVLGMGAGFGVAFLLGGFLRSPLPTALGAIAAWAGVVLTTPETEVNMLTREEVARSLQPRDEPVSRKILVFGSDGLEWSVLRELGDQLPNFRRLIEQGRGTEYQTMEPTLSPIIWSTMATGFGWEQHDVREFIYFDLPGACCDGGISGTFMEPLIRRIGRRSDMLAPYIRMTGTSHRKRLAFWQVLDLAGIPTAVVNWWGTHPPLQSNGIQISDQAVENGIVLARARDDASLDPKSQADASQNLISWLENCTQPSNAAPSIAQEFAPDRIADHIARARGFLKDVDFNLDDGRLPQKQVDRYTRALIHGEVVRQLIEDGNQEVYVYYDRLTDQISHLFWQFYRPNEEIYGDRAPAPEAVAGLQDMVPASYRATDYILGRLLDELGDDGLVLVVSDHGFSPIRPPGKFRYGEQDSPPRSGHHHHGEPGVFLISGPNVCKGTLVGEVGILDFAPTLLYLAGLPASEEMGGRVVTDFLCEEWVEAHPPRRVAGFEHPEWLQEVADAAEAAQASGMQMQDLAELGYLNN